MDILVLIFGCICSALFGAVGVIAAVWKSKEKKNIKEKEEKLNSILTNHNQAQKKVNEEKKENEEKIHTAHSGNHLSNANAVLDLLRK